MDRFEGIERPYTQKDVERLRGSVRIAPTEELDRDAMAACYHDDAIDDHGNWIRSGRQVPEHVVTAILPGSARAMHFLGNLRIEVEGGTAFTESYLLAFRAFERDGRAYTRTRALRFVDRLTRRNGEWRIAERVAVDDWNRIDEVDEPTAVCTCMSAAR